MSAELAVPSLVSVDRGGVNRWESVKEEEKKKNRFMNLCLHTPAEQ